MIKKLLINLGLKGLQKFVGFGIKLCRENCVLNWILGLYKKVIILISKKVLSFDVNYIYSVEKVIF